MDRPRLFGFALGSPERQDHVDALVELRELAGERALALYCARVRTERAPSEFAMPVYGLPQRFLEALER